MTNVAPSVAFRAERHRSLRAVLGVLRWWLRVDAYVLLLTDQYQYPPYTFA